MKLHDRTVKVRVSSYYLSALCGPTLSFSPTVSARSLSHPRDNAWTGKDSDKCDRVDAFKLAELLRRLNRAKTTSDTELPQVLIKMFVDEHAPVASTHMTKEGVIPA